METSYANIRDGRKVVATAGTAERLVASNTSCRKVEITALAENTGYVVVGDSTVVASAGTRRGLPISSGTTLTVYVEDLYTLFLDVETAGEGVSFIYYF
jgi:hypothetical protein